VQGDCAVAAMIQRQAQKVLSTITQKKNVVRQAAFGAQLGVHAGDELGVDW
jgi:hypothetical protein